MLTKRQKQILDFYNKFSKKHEYSPSLEETAKHFHLSSVSGIHQHIQALIEKGCLSRQKNKPRGIEIEKSEKLVKIPLLGTIAAGGPIEAIRSPEIIEVMRSMLSSGANHYALKVLGVSMIEEGISDGDIVIVREQSAVNDGEKAVAYLPDKNTVTLKKIYREQNRIKLVPTNKTMKPFYEKNIEVQGKVVGVLRKEI
ncbi:MAG: transcriptional repressor LexA [Parcubacteria group bacterium]|nr:transcriptional repressor LexA [Parcubacteria group bacterium]